MLFQLLLALLFYSTAGADRLAVQLAGGARNDTARRLLAAGSERRLRDEAAVSVEISQPSQEPQFQPHKMGGYRSEERAYWEQIYDVDRTLGPLRMVSNRFQISLQDAELGPDGSFLDPQKTQWGILQKCAAAVSSDVFVTVGYPWTAKSKWLIKNNFPKGWEAYWQRVYDTLADALAGPYWTGKTVWVELLGEPDLKHWSFVYGADRFRIYSVVKMMYQSFGRYRDKFRIGGCGFALPSSPWVGQFLDFYKSNGLQFDFFSYHTYLGWTDATDPSTYPTGSGGINFKYRNNVFYQMLVKKGLQGVPIVVSEYAWQDADLRAASGFGDLAKSGRFAMTRWKSCARTLQAINIILNEPSVARAYWAQGVGKVASAGSSSYLYSYNPFVIFDQFSSTYKYKASYYAFWIYGQLEGTRVVTRTSDSRIGVWGTLTAVSEIRIAIWNRSTQPLVASLSLPGVPDTWGCTMYRVDDTTFQVSSQGKKAVISGPSSLMPPLEPSVQTVKHAQEFLRVKWGLRPEATVYLVIRMG